MVALSAAQSFVFTAGPMQQARAQQTATVLPDGRVLLAGGSAAGEPLATAEIFDPASSTFQATGSMTRARSGATAQPLPDGRVLIIGGGADGGAVTSDIYDPAQGSFAAGPGLSFGLANVVSARLTDGRILVTGVAGGSDCGGGSCTAPVEIFDPATVQFTAAGTLQLARSGETVTTLASGKVLIFNGWSVNSQATSPTNTYEIYDPATATSALFDATTAAVFNAAAVRLEDGTVLICGGGGHDTGFSQACELFDPTTQTVKYTAGEMAAGRNQATATLLHDGRVLIAGGNNAAPDTEIYDPNLQTLTPAGNFNTERADFTATRLGDGTVLLAGGDQGDSSGPALATAEIFQPGSATADFSLAADATLVTVSTVSSASFQISVRGANGFSGAVALQCVNTGTAVCSFAPPSLQAGASSTLTVSGLDTSQSSRLDFQVVGTSGTLSHSLELHIAIAPPLPQLTPTALNFGDQSVGSTSAAQKVTLTNGGAGTLHITKISTAGDFAQTNDCGATLANGAPPCTINVTFQPTAAGPRSGVLQVEDDGPFSPQSVALSGTGQTTPAPAVTLAPKLLNFGQQPVGVTSSAQTVTLTNSGTSGLTFQAVAASGDFSVSSNCPTTLTPRVSCALTVMFTPTAVGARSGQLQVSDDAGDSPQTVALSGSGVTGLAPAAALTPSSLSFPDQVLNASSAELTVTLTNAGTASLVIASITTTGEFAASEDCGQSLAAGASCSIGVSFTPTALGPQSGQLTVSDSAGDSPQTVALSGQGVAAGGPSGGQVTLVPAAGGSDTAAVDAGNTAIYNLVVQGGNGFTGNINLSCSGAPAGAACTLSPGAVTLGVALTPIVVKVSTTAAATGGFWPPAAPGWPWLLLAALAPLGLSLVRGRRRGRGLVPAACLLALALGLAGCGDNSTTTPPPPPTPTPPGTYQLTVTATVAGPNTPAGAIVLTLVVR